MKVHIVLRADIAATKHGRLEALLLLESIDGLELLDSRLLERQGILTVRFHGKIEKLQEMDVVELAQENRFRGREDGM